VNATILGLLAETSIHPGAGSDTGFVDLPVAREAATDYPVIVGSSFKGALLDRARNDNVDESIRTRVFGEQNSAGSLLVSDARLLLLPVRSLTSHYKWVTCPHLLERFLRDRTRAGLNGKAIDIAGPDKDNYLGTGQRELYLEERQFERQGDLPAGIIDVLKPLIAHQDTTAMRLTEQLVILHNDDFAWFARFGLAVNARNVLDNEKKTSKNLWYEETIPPDSLFYCLLAERNGNALDEARKLFDKRPYIQVGGNETVGQGWMAVTWLEASAPKGGAV
jgi:CRISPR-associated protein Cmr4